METLTGGWINSHKHKRMVHVIFRRNENCLQNFCLKIWRRYVVVYYINKIRIFIKDIGSGMSNGFIWLSIEIFTGQHCTSQSNAFSPRYWNCHTKYYLNLNSGAARYYRQYYTGPSEHCAVSVLPSGGHKAETYQRCGVINLLTTLAGNPPENTRS